MRFNRKVDVLVDLQFGSTGKGLLSGYLGVEKGYEAVISCNAPNAGHTAYCPETGQKFVHKVLPSAIFGEELKVIGIGPGAVFFIDRLQDEWEAVCKYRDDLVLVIHEAACVARPEHKEAEGKSLSRISSTMQGSAEALISKIRREPQAVAGNWGFALIQALGQFGQVRIANQSAWLDIMGSKSSILVEGSQGYSLGLSSGFYPYCTSRDCTVGRVLADANLPIAWLRDTFGCARVHPIRVGNTPDGYSGDWYDDQTETTFGALGVEPELTTVTQRVRRVASFSALQIREAMIMAHPTAVFLNFAQYDPVATAAAIEAIEFAAGEIGCGGVGYIGTGPLPSDIKEVE